MSVAGGRTADMRTPHSDLPEQDPQQWSPPAGHLPPPRLPWERDWRRRPLPDAVAVRRCPVPAWAPPFDIQAGPAQASLDRPGPGPVIRDPRSQDQASKDAPAPGQPRPEAAGPEAAGPGGAGPQKVRPGAAGPGAAGPGAAGPGGAGPRAAGPRAAGPEAAGPGGAGPGGAGPQKVRPGAAGPRAAGPEKVRPRTAGPVADGAAEPGAAGSTAAGSKADGLGAARPSSARPGAAGQDAARPGSARPEAAGQDAARRAGAERAPGRPDTSRRPGQPPHEAEWAGGWPSQFAQVLAEALAGSRPAQQVRPWTTEQARKRIRQLGPVLQADQRPRVRRVLTSQPRRGVVEMTVIVGIGPRTRALAVRLEHAGLGSVAPDRAGRAPTAREPDGWVCTAIEAA